MLLDLKKSDWISQSQLLLEYSSDISIGGYSTIIYSPCSQSHSNRRVRLLPIRASPIFTCGGQSSLKTMLGWTVAFFSISNFLCVRLFAFPGHTNLKSHPLNPSWKRGTKNYEKVNKSDRNKSQEYNLFTMEVDILCLKVCYIFICRTIENSCTYLCTWFLSIWSHHSPCLGRWRQLQEFGKCP